MQQAGPWRPNRAASARLARAPRASRSGDAPARVVRPTRPPREWTAASTTFRDRADRAEDDYPSPHRPDQGLHLTYDGLDPRLRLLRWS